MIPVRFLYMSTLQSRIKEIVDELPGPERGKQSRLAEIAGCTRGLINQLIKTNGQDLGYEYAKNIEKKLGYRVDWILKGTLPKRLTDKEEKPSKVEVTTETLEIALAIEKLKEEAQKNAIVTQLKAFGVLKVKQKEALLKKMLSTSAQQKIGQLDEYESQLVQFYRMINIDKKTALLTIANNMAADAQAKNEHFSETSPAIKRASARLKETAAELRTSEEEEQSQNDN